MPFILYSSLKPEGYLVTGPRLHLHYVIKNGVVEGLHQIEAKRSWVANNDEEVLSQVKLVFANSFF